MGAANAADRLTEELHRVLDRISVDFERIEILSQALSGFSQPVPDYEPGFRQWLLDPDGTKSAPDRRRKR